jgi:multidrug efflux pump
MNGSGAIYMESVAQADGTGSITLSFAPGTNPDLAQVDVQNRLSRAAPRLPLAVTQQGVRVDKARSNFLLVTILSSENPQFDPIALGDYAARNVLPEIQRLPVSARQLFGTERATCASGRPGQARASTCRPTTSRYAIRAQNAQVCRYHRRPPMCGPARAVSPPWSCEGQLGNVSSSATSLRANADGSAVRLATCAHRAGAQNYATSARLNGNPPPHRRAVVAERQPAAAATPSRRAWTSWVLSARHDVRIPTTLALRADVDAKVVETLLEAVALVFR